MVLREEGVTNGKGKSKKYPQKIRCLVKKKERIANEFERKK